MNEPRGITRRTTRRQLLQWGAAAAGASWLAGCGEGPGPVVRRTVNGGLVLGPGNVGEGDDARFVLGILDLNTRGPARHAELDFMGHGVVPDPTDPGRVAIFEKRGPGACIADLREAKTVEPIPTADEREFYGHGAFSPDGSLLYATETVVADDYRGVVVVRDGRTLEELGEFPTYGAAPHDCVLRDGGKTLVFTNGGSKEPGGSRPSVTYVDASSEELIEKVELDDESVNAGHLALTERGDLAIVSAPRDWLPRDTVGAATFRPLGGEVRTMADPGEVTRRMIGESLSVAVHEASGVVGVTNPRGHLVTFWSLREGTLLGSLDLTQPRGIALTLDQQRFVVSYGRRTSLVYVDPGTLLTEPGTRVAETGMSGSHIVVHDLA